ncbi:MAG: NAD(P)/FAD-dependent oxidoreductase [Alphaproteobacteria bacterium]|nr:NAD(P)/FAD-dependent oxidoreductase [Candidatus Jidaibacter sp.]
MANKNNKSTDVLIIGAGPSGLFSIFQLGMLGIKCVVIDSLDSIGGQCSALYPEKPIYDIPAYPIVSAQSLIDNLLEQASPFNPEFILSDTVVDITKENAIFKAVTKAGITVFSKAVIISTGGGAFGPNRPPLEGIENFEGSSVFYSVTDKLKFKGANVAIAGGGDSAADWAVELSNFANKIYVVHRRDKFRAADSTIEKMRMLVNSGKIELVVPYQLSALNGDAAYLKSIEVSDLNNNKKVLDVDYLLPFFGLKTEVGPMVNWDLKLDDNRVLVDTVSMQTSREGIFAVGDIASYNCKLKLILTGFAEAALAAHNIYKIIFPEKALHFEYSTTKGLPS